MIAEEIYGIYSKQDKSSRITEELPSCEPVQGESWEEMIMGIILLDLDPREKKR